MKRNLKLILLLIGLQSALTALYFAVEDAPEPVRVEQQNRACPELVYLSPDGAQGRLSELKGRPVLLHFWATWCPPCRAELPSLLQLAEQDEVYVLAVSLDTSWAEVRTFFEGPPPKTVVLAQTPTVSDAFSVPRLPETLFIDSAGRIRLRFVGERDWTKEAIRQRLRDFQ